MVFSWKKSIAKAQLVFKRRKRLHLKHGLSDAAKREDKRIK